jgi:fructosamine-3-kinase
MEGQVSKRLADFTARQRQTFYPKTDLPVPDAILQKLRNLSDAELGLTAEALHQVATAAFRPGTPPLSRLPRQGTFHRLYLAELAGGARRVVRFDVTGDYWSGHTLHLEKWAVSKARAAGVPAPAVLLTDTSRRICPLDFQIMEWVPDRSLQEFDDDEPEMQRLLAKLGTQFARLHGVKVERWGWFDISPLLAVNSRGTSGLFEKWKDYVTLRLEDHVEACSRMDAIGNETGRRILDLFTALKSHLTGFEPALLHGDPGSHNAMTDGREITALLDWEDCLAGDPVYELAFWATFHPERRHAVFLQAYRTIRPLPDDFEVRFWLYFLRIALAKTVHRHRFGYVDRPGRPPAAQRIQTSLERLEAALVLHT